MKIRLKRLLEHKNQQSAKSINNHEFLFLLYIYIVRFWFSIRQVAKSSSFLYCWNIDSNGEYAKKVIYFEIWE